MVSTPTGKTGFPKWNTSVDIPDGVAQDLELGQHFDDLIGETVANAAALPSSGNWVNRQIMAVDTKVVYACTALPGTWKALSALEDTGWTVVGSGGGAPAFGTGWTAFTSTGWSGVRYRVKNGVLYISGSAQKGTYAGGLADPIFTLPAGSRPATRFIMFAYGSAGASYLAIEANGDVTPAVAGTGQINFSGSAPVG